MYYEAEDGKLTGLRHFIWGPMNETLWWLSPSDFKYISVNDTAEAKWFYIWNDMGIQPNPDPYAVMHETIHAYNDRWDKYDDPVEDDEGLAWAAMAMAQQLEDKLQPFEDLLGADSLKSDELSMAWRRAWLFLDVVGDPKDGGKKITETDVKRVGDHLGIHVSCGDLAKMYNQLDNVQEACIEFVCDPKAKPSQGEGWTAIPVMKKLSSVFK